MTFGKSKGHFPLTGYYFAGTNKAVGTIIADKELCNYRKRTIKRQK